MRNFGLKSLALIGFLIVALSIVSCGGGGEGSNDSGVSDPNSDVGLTTIEGAFTANDFVDPRNGLHADLYTFTASESGTATITMTSSECDVGLGVMDESENPIAYSDENDGRATDVSFPVTQGTHYFLLAAERTGATGPYTLTFSRNLSNVQPLVGGVDISGPDVGNGGGSTGDVDRIWVHVKHMGNAISNLCFYNNKICPTPTAHMLLVDASGNQISIEPLGCITTGGGPGAWVFSGWEIDQVSSTEPNPEPPICDHAGIDGLGQERCISAWYPIDLPAGFKPVQYVAGCSIYLPFQFNY